MSVLILEPVDYSPRAVRLYETWGVVWHGEVPHGRTPEVKVLVVRLAHMLNEAFLSTYPNLRVIVTPTTGLGHIDMAWCARRCIQVVSLAACRESIERVTSTSELALGLILALLRRIPQAHEDVVANKRWRRDRFRGRQLSSLTLGVVGLGRLGGQLVRSAHALGVKVEACDPYQADSRFESLRVARSDLTAVMKHSDVLSIHADLRDDNHNLIGARQIDLLPRGALVVNTARGALLDEAAAANALREGRLGGVAVDVLADEHSNAKWGDSPLVVAARDGLNVIVTPHIGGCTIDAMQITEECIAEAALKVLGGFD